MMKAHERMDIFYSQHPRFIPFLETVRAKAVREGTIVEIKVTTPEGKDFVTNLRLTPDDVETINIMTENL